MLSKRAVKFRSTSRSLWERAAIQFPLPLGEGQGEGPFFSNPVVTGAACASSS